MSYIQGEGNTIPPPDGRVAGPIVELLVGMGAFVAACFGIYHLLV